MTFERSLPGVPNPLHRSDKVDRSEGRAEDGPRWRTTGTPPIRFVETPRGDDAFEHPPLTEKFRRLVMLDVIHDGDIIPQEFLEDSAGRPISREAFETAYEQERDWGASNVATALAKELGVDGYWRVELARVVMDFGRFPGITPKDASHLDRRAINYPFSDLLDFTQKRRVLECYYDAISEVFERAVGASRVKLAIHTYDTFNKSGTRRPPMSILTRPVGYQVLNEMPYGVFDPLYPDILGQFTADRMLRDRLSLTLERAGIATEHNYPYLLPDGSVEVRSQVWSFFQRARGDFQAEHPETIDDPAYKRVWAMLLDTNLRSTESDLLRGYLHFYRRPPPGGEDSFASARQAYTAICAFVRKDNGSLVERYRKDNDRRSTLGIEVRKDLVWNFDPVTGRPQGPIPGAAEQIAKVLARGLRVYFEKDRPLRDEDTDSVGHELSADLFPPISGD